MISTAASTRIARTICGTVTLWRRASPRMASACARVMGADRNRVIIVTANGTEEWPEMDKDAVAGRLAGLIARKIGG